MKTLRQLLIKKNNIENWKKALEWWIVIIDADKVNLIEEGKKIGINRIVQYVIVKSQDLLKIKRQKDY